ncbi:MAG: GTPase ObgE [Deltaproteobacteria bacterium]|jgi:GTP-binding protein|nr:GTPase ObgE [Deltaproteobacteria bacterium]
MRFIDEATVTLRAGKGGAGCVAFRREKFIPFGGPSGGNGGDGGCIILRASSKLLSLYDFRLKRNYEAENGRPGQGSQMHGRGGHDLILELPVGTQVFQITDQGEHLLADLPEAGQETLVARGGRGGKGNEFFKSATQQAPRFAQPGEEGEYLQVRLELKILADCGLIGLPNAGKSTFISTVSAAKPKIAPYPFTTLIPNLGVMLHDGDYDRRLVIADIPGLIEGAHQGQGLGHRFLKHVERTRFLIHILSAADLLVAPPAATERGDEDEEQAIEDASLQSNDEGEDLGNAKFSGQDEDATPQSNDADEDFTTSRYGISPDPWAGFDLINEELRLFDQSLSERMQIEVVNKIDLLTPEQLAALQERANEDGRRIIFISALERQGLEPLIEEMWRLQAELEQNEPLLKSRASQMKGADADDAENGPDDDPDDNFDGDGVEIVYSR